MTHASDIIQIARVVEPYAPFLGMWFAGSVALGVIVGRMMKLGSDGE